MPQMGPMPWTWLYFTISMILGVYLAWVYFYQLPEKKNLAKETPALPSLGWKWY